MKPLTQINQVCTPCGMNDAIKRATDADYKYHGDNLIYDDNLDQFCVTDGDGGFFAIRSEILLDPLFWQALGKAEGWTNNTEIILSYEPTVQKMATWHFQMRCFINHLAEGKDIDSFFTQLLIK